MNEMKKITIVMVAAVLLGVFALPSVMSVGTGQHTFKNGTSVDCDKCHANSGDTIANEIAMSDTVMYATLGASAGQKIHALDGYGMITGCRDCHLLAGEMSYLDGQHTGVTREPQCTSCHMNVDPELSGAEETHSAFASQGNAGCIGCHTDVQVSGSPSYSLSGAVQVAGLTIGD